MHWWKMISQVDFLREAEVTNFTFIGFFNDAVHFANKILTFFKDLFTGLIVYEDWMLWSKEFEWTGNVALISIEK